MVAHRRIRALSTHLGIAATLWWHSRLLTSFSIRQTTASSSLTSSTSSSYFHFNPRSRRIQSMSTACAAGEVAPRLGDDLRMANLRIGASSVLLSSPSWISVALGGLQPIVEGHAVVIPRRSAVRLKDLPEEDLLDLWRTARSAQATLERHHSATASNWAVFDGLAAGQPLEHVHVHVLPRKAKDFAENDQVYAALETWQPAPGLSFESPPPISWPADEDRRPRTGEEMSAEASAYRNAFKDLSEKLGVLPEEQAFAKLRIDGSNLFFASKSGLTVGFVNLKPLLPGHVLVTPRRVVPRIADLTDEEFDDLFRSVQLIQNVIEEYHGAQASRLGIQDGRDAGQSVAHVHVHILPIPAPKPAL